MSGFQPNPALLLALVVGVLNVGAGILGLGISRAPGWAIARVSGGIALSAGCYSLLNALFCTEGLGEGTYLLAGRLAYFVGCIHALLWLLYAVGGPEGRISLLPRWAKATAGSALAISVFFLISGYHLRPVVETVDVGWAGVRYHYPVANLAGNTLGMLLLVLLAVPFGWMTLQSGRGQRTAWLQVCGFCLFLPCALVEVMVANRMIRFISPSDLGFLVLVLPLSVEQLRRFAEDARRLHALSGRLVEEVRMRTVERDRAGVAYAESERLAALGRLAAGVGHEVANPLSCVQLALEQAESGLRGHQGLEAVKSSVADARDGARRIAVVVQSLRNLATPGELKSPVELQWVMDDALKVARPHLQPGTRLNVVPLRGARVLANEASLIQAIANLLTNAAQATANLEHPGALEIAISFQPPNSLCLVVSDNGPGIAAADLPRVTEPYYTTRGPQGSLGLGLFIARRIIEEHGGLLELRSELGQGTQARVTLPLLDVVSPSSRDAAAAESANRPRPAGRETGVPANAGAARSPATPSSAEGTAAEMSRAKPRLLVVDDEPALLKIMIRLLQAHWEVTGARDGREALGLIRQSPFDALLCDVMMPGMTGIELARQLENEQPALRRRTLFVTGGIISTEAENFLRRPDVIYVSKPASMAEVQAILSRFLAEGDAMSGGADAPWGAATPSGGAAVA